MDATKLVDLTPAQRTKILEFASTHPIGVLATLDQDGGPHASTIYFNVDKDLHFGFTTKRETTKYTNLVRDGRVMLVAYDAPKQAALQVSGRAIEVTDQQKQQEIYRATVAAAKETGDDVVPPIAKITGGEFVSFSVEIDVVSYSEFGWGDNFKTALKHANDSSPSGDPS